MKTMKKIITLSIAAMLLAALGTNIGFAGKPGGGGKGGKVTVELATPNSVIQTNEEDVTIVGTGFDNGSSVRFLITGTTDDSQIEVGSAQYISSTELKVHIKTNGSTATVDYDIEVQAASGRKGKGTTLFKVQQADVACTGSEPKEPTIAYVTRWDDSTDPETQDLMLSNSSGCDQYLLIKDVSARLPNIKKYEDQDRVIRTAWFIRYSVRGNTGVVSWIDESNQRLKIMGVSFEFDGLGSILVDPNGSSQLYLPLDNRDVWTDVHLSDTGDLWLAMFEHDLDTSARILSFLNYDSGEYEALTPESCGLQDESGDCFYPLPYSIRWSPSGEEIFFRVSNYLSSDERSAVAKVSKTENGWTDPEFVIMDPMVSVNRGGSISSSGFINYSYTEEITNKRGKHLGSTVHSALLDTEQCTPNLCLPSDGVSISNGIGSGIWTSSGSLLFRPNSFEIGEYLDPFSDEVSNLSILNAIEFDSDL